DIALTYTFGLGFGFSKADGIYIDTTGVNARGDEITLDLSATFPGAEVSGQLGPLNLTVKDVVQADRDLAFLSALADTDGPSGVFGSFSVDLQDSGGDGRLSIGETPVIVAK